MFLSTIHGEIRNYCVMKKIMSQIELSPVTDFRYETKVGFLFMVGEATQLALLVSLGTITDPQSKAQGSDGTSCFQSASGRSPTRNMNTFLKSSSS